MLALGLLLGSFMNVCILRLPAGKSVARPASGCPRCGHLLAWWENIPVVSFLLLRARCRNCHTPISWQYPAIELLTGLLYVGLTLEYGFGWLLYARVLLVSAMVVLFMISLRHARIPIRIPQLGLLVGLFFSLFTTPGLTDALIGAALGGVGLLLVALVARRLLPTDIGTGEALMLAMVGAFLGWQGMLVTLGLAAFVAILLGVVAVTTGTVRLRFTTALALATLVTAFADATLLDWISRGR